MDGNSLVVFVQEKEMSYLDYCIIGNKGSLVLDLERETHTKCGIAGC